MADQQQDYKSFGEQVRDLAIKAQTVHVRTGFVISNPAGGKLHFEKAVFLENDLGRTYTHISADVATAVKQFRKFLSPTNSYLNAYWQSLDDVEFDYVDAPPLYVLHSALAEQYHDSRLMLAPVESFMSVSSFGATTFQLAEWPKVCGDIPPIEVTHDTMITARQQAYLQHSPQSFCLSLYECDFGIEVHIHAIKLKLGKDLYLPVIYNACPNDDRRDPLGAENDQPYLFCHFHIENSKKNSQILARYGISAAEADTINTAISLAGGHNFIHAEGEVVSWSHLNTLLNFWKSYRD